MFKYLKALVKLVPALLKAYFGWMVRYSRHPERYPLEERYAKVRKLIITLSSALNVEYVVNTLKYFQDGETYLLVGNHISMWDAIVFLTISEKPIKFLAKIEARKMMFVRRIMPILDAMYIERGVIKNEAKIMREIRYSLARKEGSWIIFPEGTRNKIYDGSVADFHPGTFKMALETGTTIIPIAIYGSHRPLDLKDKAAKYTNLITFLDPVTSADYAGKNTVKVASEIHETVEKEVKRLVEVEKSYLLKNRKPERKK